MSKFKAVLVCSSLLYLVWCVSIFCLGKVWSNVFSHAKPNQNDWEIDWKPSCASMPSHFHSNQMTEFWSWVEIKRWSWTNHGQNQMRSLTYKCFVIQFLSESCVFHEMALPCFLSLRFSGNNKVNATRESGEINEELEVCSNLSTQLWFSYSAQ